LDILGIFISPWYFQPSTFIGEETRFSQRKKPFFLKKRGGVGGVYGGSVTNTYLVLIYLNIFETRKTSLLMQILKAII